MANTTTREALTIHGTNPQFLIETAIRYRIWDSTYWKETCFGLTAESIIDEAVKIPYIGGTYANQKPTHFLCLALKLLQLQPDREIILEYLRAEDFKYLRALAAFYVRLTFDSLNAYEILEKLLDDYRKLRVIDPAGQYSLTTMDQFADELLNEERVCDIQLPRLTLRHVLESTEALPKRRSKLAKAMGINFDHLSSKSKEEKNLDADSAVSDDSDRYISRSPTPEDDKSQSSHSGSEAGWHTGRYVSRSPTPGSEGGGSANEDGEDNRYISRSPSPAASDEDGRYISRSASPASSEHGD